MPLAMRPRGLCLHPIDVLAKQGNGRFLAANHAERSCATCAWPQVWAWEGEILPCRTYCRHCVLAVTKAGPLVIPLLSGPLCRLRWVLFVALVLIMRGTAIPLSCPEEPTSFHMQPSAALE